MVTGARRDIAARKRHEHADPDQSDQVGDPDVTRPVRAQHQPRGPSGEERGEREHRNQHPQRAAQADDRMPVILNDLAAEEWMDPNNPEPPSLTRLLVPAPDSLLSSRSVSPKVNSPKFDSPDLLEAIS
jgi:SOS response associated peptidase (SRAP)